MRFGRSRRFVANLAALAILSLTLAACGGSDSGSGTTSGESGPGTNQSSSGQPVEPLVYGSAEKVTTLDPQMSMDVSVLNAALQVFDPLVERTATGEIVPALATAWETPDDLTWRFELRQGVRYHDGQPFDAQAVKFTLERLVNPETKSPFAGLWADLERVEVIDDYTVELHTTHPVGPMLFHLAITPILPPNADEVEGFFEQPVGTGPFKLVTWAKGDRLEFAANPDYWRGAPALERMIWREIPEITTRMSALESSEIDIAARVPPEEIDRLAAASHIELLYTPTFRQTFIWMNGERTPFDQPEVRDALRYAINTQEIIDNIMGGMAERATGPVPEGVFGYYPFEPYPYDPERARELLTAAGYPDGFSVELKFSELDPKNREIVDVLVAQLAQVGIQVQPVLQDTALWVSDLLKLDWDINLAATSTLTGDADFTLRRIYHSTARRTGYANPDLDAALERGQRSVSPEERQAGYQQAQEILWTDGPAVWFFSRREAVGVNERVSGFAPAADELLRFRSVTVKH